MDGLRFTHAQYILNHIFNHRKTHLKNLKFRYGSPAYAMADGWNRGHWGATSHHAERQGGCRHHRGLPWSATAAMAVIEITGCGPLMSLKCLTKGCKSSFPEYDSLREAYESLFEKICESMTIYVSMSATNEWCQIQEDGRGESEPGKNPWVGGGQIPTPLIHWSCFRWGTSHFSLFWHHFVVVQFQHHLDDITIKMDMGWYSMGIYVSRFKKPGQEEIGRILTFIIHGLG